MHQAHVLPSKPWADTSTDRVIHQAAEGKQKTATGKPRAAKECSKLGTAHVLLTSHGTTSGQKQLDITGSKRGAKDCNRETKGSKGQQKGIPSNAMSLTFKPLDGIKIQVIGGLIKKKQVRL